MTNNEKLSEEMNQRMCVFKRRCYDIYSSPQKNQPLVWRRMELLRTWRERDNYITGVAFSWFTFDFLFYRIWTYARNIFIVSVIMVKVDIIITTWLLRKSNTEHISLYQKLFTELTNHQIYWILVKIKLNLLSKPDCRALGWRLWNRRLWEEMNKAKFKSILNL